LTFGSRSIGVALKAARRLAQFIPDPTPDPLQTAGGEIGKPIDRLDGAAKAKGQLLYTADQHIANVAHAVLVSSTIARGRIVEIDSAEAEKAPGVLKIVTHQNAPRMKRTPAYGTLTGPVAGAVMSVPILNTDEIFWNGQPIAIVIAESHEQADLAAKLVRVRYESVEARLSLDAERANAFAPNHCLAEESDVDIGDANTALADAAVTVDYVYRTPPVNHSALELHATLASWEGERLTVHDTSHYPFGVAEMLAKKFCLKRGDVRVLSPFIGGGFGSKSAAWPHVALTVAAAKIVGRPVKLVLSRADCFYMVGARSPTESRVALGADGEGRLTALIHEALSMCTTDVFAEAAVSPSRHLYACPNISLHQRVARLDRIQNAFFRAPGDAPGSFALESAMDELAWALAVDPIDLRLWNEPLRNPTTGTTFSSRYFREACMLGAAAFGWSNRAPQPRIQRDGRWLIGQGMAAAIVPTFSLFCEVRLRLAADGSVSIRCSTNELGTGTSTTQTQAAAERLGLPAAKFEFVHGDSEMGKTRIPGASATTASVSAAIWAACDNIVRRLLRLVDRANSPLAGARYSDVESREGGLYLKAAPQQGETYTDILLRAGCDAVEATGKAPLPYSMMKYSMHAYGAHFCEVRVDEDTSEVRIVRWVGAFDGGRIINPKHAKSQLQGGIIMGVGMALTEETLLDERTGRIPNRTLTEYLVPTNPDVPEIEVLFVDRPDPLMPLAAKGIGELGIVGTAASIANAVYHATGKRIRTLPITIDKLL
jgi:xanthine dehydrogenase YagR molybdenum-binding subunit